MLRRSLTLLAVLLFTLGTVASAQLPGTLFGQIFDDETDEPLEGVEIVVTDPEKESFRQVEMTDKRGRYKVFLRNTNPEYTFTFNKESYQSFTMPNVKVVARKDERRNWYMKTAEYAVQQAQEAQIAAESAAAEDVETKGNYIKVYNEGVAAMDIGNVAAAEMLFADVLTKRPDYGPAHGGMARVYWKQENWDKAIEHAQRSMELNPEDTEINQVLYAAYNGLGRKKEASAILKEMQAADPEKAGQNLFNQAADLYNQGNTADAKPILEQVVAGDPGNARAYYMLGLCYISEGANDPAKEALGRFLELAPDDPDSATAKEMLDYLE